MKIRFYAKQKPFVQGAKLNKISPFAIGSLNHQSRLNQSHDNKEQPKETISYRLKMAVKQQSGKEYWNSRQFCIFERNFSINFYKLPDYVTSCMKFVDITS